MASGTDPEPTAVPAEVLEQRKKRIKEAFDVFDLDVNGTIISEEVPTVLRYLGIWPSDVAMVETILPEMQEEEPTRFISFEKFEAVALKLLASGEHAPDTEDVLLRAFRALDPEDTGVLDPAKIKELLMEEGESPFREDEAEAFLRFATDLESGKVLYEEYVAKLAAAAQ